MAAAAFLAWVGALVCVLGFLGAMVISIVVLYGFLMIGLDMWKTWRT